MLNFCFNENWLPKYNFNQRKIMNQILNTEGFVEINEFYDMSVKDLFVSFKYVERITSVFDLFNYSFGGWLDGANLSGNFGPIKFNIPNALYRVSNQQLPSGIIERTTEGFYRMTPDTPNTENFLFNIT